MNGHKKMINMPGYNMIYKNRKKNGRIAILLKGHLKYTFCDDLFSKNENLKVSLLCCILKKAMIK